MKKIFWRNQEKEKSRYGPVPRAPDGFVADLDVVCSPADLVLK